MRRLPLSTVVLALFLVTGAFWLAVLPPRARAGDEKKPHLNFRKTYAEALLEGRIRNAVVLVSRHKDD